ncbi:PEP-CTERM sorting domain-containing protein [Nitrosomonas ureae]|uniref:PEP-CTERM sorting domain-containing protein n=1 Tax=Nitrosomonas ureae TaxID=44577 RepID=UPI000BB7A2B8|nr:PEP-CTERM sorting domain-containing protein [Nitrosomonas ureae]
MKFKRTAIVFAAIYAISAPALGYADWSLTKLGTLGGASSFASALNDVGQVVGASEFVPGGKDRAAHAYITGSDGIGMTDLGAIRRFSFAQDINETGQVVGATTVDRVTGFEHAFITGLNGAGLIDLGTLGGGNSRALGINDSGQVVGRSEITLANNTSHAFVTGANGAGMTDLGTLSTLTGRFSEANAINNSGQVVGWSHTDEGYSHAFITGPNGVGMTDLALSLGLVSESNSIAYDINNSGQVVGSFNVSPTLTHGFVTGPDGVGMIDLSTTFFDGKGSNAFSINDAGEVLVSVEVNSNTFDTFLYRDGKMINLDLLDVFVTSGYKAFGFSDLNNNGQIVGTGVYNLFSPSSEAFLLSPVPEPETYAMLLAGLGLIGFMVRRRAAGM